MPEWTKIIKTKSINQVKEDPIKHKDDQWFRNSIAEYIITKILGETTSKEEIKQDWVQG